MVEAVKGLRISPSSRKTFMDCIRKWYILKVLGIAEGAQDHLILGGAVHALNERFVLVGTHPEVRTREVTDQVDDAAHYSGGLEELARKASEVSCHGMRFLEQIRTFARKNPDNVLVEKQLAGTCGPIPYMSYSDLCFIEGPDGVPTILDYKTSKDPGGRYAHHRPEQVAADPQLLFYAYALFYLILGYRGPVRVGHIYFPTQGGADKAREITGIATQEAIEANWAHFEDVAAQMLETSKIQDVKDVAPNRASCDKYKGCAYKNNQTLCPSSSKGYTPTPTNKQPEKNMASALEALAKLKAAKAAVASAQAAPVQEPAPDPLPALTAEQKEELVSKLLDYAERGALSTGLVDGLLTNYSCNESDAAEIREVATALMAGNEDSTGRVNPPTATPAPETPEEALVQKRRSMRVCAGNLAAHIEDGGQVSQSMLDLFTQDKGFLPEDIQAIKDLIIATFPDKAPEAMGPVFLKALSDDATPAQKVLQMWQMAERPDVDLSLATYRDWIKSATGMDRYGRAKAVEVMAELVAQGHLLLLADGTYTDATHVSDTTDEGEDEDEEVVVQQPAPKPAIDAAARLAQLQADRAAAKAFADAAEASAKAPSPAKAEPKPEPKPNPEPEPEKGPGQTVALPGPHLLLVGCNTFGAVPIDHWLELQGVNEVYAEVRKHDKELHELYFLSGYSKGNTTMAGIIDTALERGDVQVPFALTVQNGHPLAALLQVILTKRGWIVVQG